MGTRLRILSVAYPFAPAGPDAVGGAEQILTAIDTALVAAGHHSTVIAAEGSRVAGRLVTVPADIADPERTHAAVREAIARCPADLVHLHGIDFPAYLPPPGPPVLATLHLPPDWYPPGALTPARPRTWLHCVSAAQHAACPPSAALLPPIANGVALAQFAGRHARRGYALTLGRICPEKGQHLALDTARMAGLPLLLAGEAFGYPAHRAYLEQQIRPRLDRCRRWIGSVGLVRKRRLLAAARCLLIPSLAAETSSLVAMEASASGTPVIAFAAGALPDLVIDGVTGFVVADTAGMAAAIARVHRIDPEACRQHARENFDAAAMTGAYLARYRALV